MYDFIFMFVKGRLIYERVKPERLFFGLYNGVLVKVKPLYA